MTSKPRYNPGQLPLFEPESSWKLPSELPDLRGHKVIALDLETKDDGIARDMGSGWPYKAGHICGVSMAAGDTAVYAPVRHPDTENFAADNVRRWVEDHVRCGATIVTQFGSYDWGWLGSEWGIRPADNRDDTHAMAYMLDENRRSYSLNSLCQQYGVPGKDEEQLRRAAAAYGVDPKGGMWRMPARHVGSYGEQDARALLPLRERMLPLLEADGLMDAYRLEMDLVPMVVAMRARGIRIDTKRVPQVQDLLYAERDKALMELSRNLTTGRAVTIEDIRSPAFLERVFRAEGINFPMTPKSGRGSFSKDWMEKVDHWLPRSIVTATAMHDGAHKFVGKYLSEYTHRGRIHAEIHQMRSEDGGTVSYRFSYSDPALQQMPAINEVIARAIRSLFLPEEGEEWASPDYNQQEYRLCISDAIMLKMPGADDAQRYYMENEDADAHKMVGEMTGLPRKKAKIQNFAIIYGQGKKARAEALGLSLEEEAELKAKYDEAVPWASKLSEFLSKRAESRGFIKLIDGARCRFDLWEPAWRGDASAYYGAAPLEKAREWYPNCRLKRAFTHKALNRRVQGSAARQMKMAMREVWRAGVTPLLQMHDELCLSVPDRAAGQNVADIMRDVHRLEIPVRVDVDFGKNWAEAKYGA